MCTNTTTNNNIMNMSTSIGNSRIRLTNTSPNESKLNTKCSSMDDIVTKERANRRRPSRRPRGGSMSHSLANSLNRDRRSGLAGTEGRLSQSFLDTKGLGEETIGDILKGFEDDDDNDGGKGTDTHSNSIKTLPVNTKQSMEELLGVNNSASEDEDEFNASDNNMMRPNRREMRGSIKDRMKLMTIVSQRELKCPPSLQCDTSSGGDNEGKRNPFGAF